MLWPLPGCPPPFPNPMNFPRSFAAVLAFHCALCPVRAGEDSAASCALTVPTPAEFFAALDKVGKPDWASFYREPVPTTYPVRPLAALNLGALVADGYVAVEAQDGQQVKNTGSDIIALARALGVSERVLERGKSISDFADKNDWSALKEELDATTNEVRAAMALQRDEGLAALITAGAWIRALQVGSRAAELSGEPAADGLLGQPALLAYLRSELDTLPEKTRNTPAVGQVQGVLGALHDQMDSAPSETAENGAARAQLINKTAGEFIAAISAKEQ